MKVRTLAFLTIVVFLVCFFSAVKAQQVCRPGMPCYQGPQTQQAPQAPQQDRPGTWCDLIVRVDDGGGYTSIGSGTPVRKYNNGTIVLTNNHVVEDRESDTSLTVYCPNRGTVNGKVLATDKDIDVAVVYVEADWPVVEMASSVAASATIQTRGYAGGTSFRVYSGRVRNNIRFGHFLSSPSYQGMSGGGAFQDSKYVGIIWGGDPSFCAITTITHIRPFLDRVLGSQRVDVIATPLPTPAPPQEPNTPPDLCPNCPQSCNCDERINKLIDLQADLVIKVQSLEEKVNNIPAGKDGKDGINGKDGRDGKDADTTAINAKIAALEAELLAMRNKKFRVFTHTPAGVFDSEELSVGDDIHIQYVPLGK